jgi:hypothetical protein
MVRTLLVRGMLTGVAAGLLMLGFARLSAEPTIGGAIDFDRQARLAAGDPPEVEVFSRGVQSSIGLGTAVLVYGVAVGGIFALVFAVAYGRIGRLSPRAIAALLALGGYLAVFVVPLIKYPVNPPAVGHPDTIGQRTLLYLVMLATSVVLTVLAVWAWRRWAPQLGGWNAALLATGAFTVLIALVMRLLPAVNEVPTDFPATVLWQFRLAALGNQAVLWTTLGLGFGWWTDRALRQVVAPSLPPPPHA